MNKALIAVLVIVGIVVIGVMFVAGIYNGLVRSEEGVTEAWAQVENVYQRRADLIPNLVETVKGYAAHESGTFQAVVEARAKATQMKLEPGDLSDPAKLQAFQEAQASLGGALSRLLLVVENYPDLKANQNFLALQSQLEGTENRIAVERRRFNMAARVYNTKIRQVPAALFARIFGFDKKAYFEAEEGSEQVPTVKF